MSLFAAVVAMTNMCGVVSVDTHGARVVPYVPTGGTEMFFVSETGTGGMPLCWPWFAGLGPGKDSVRHGIARYRDFEIVGRSDASADSTLTLRLKSDEATHVQFPHDFTLTVSVRLKDRLTVSMTAENVGSDPFVVTEAFHPYFSVSDSERCVVANLDSSECRIEDSVSGRVVLLSDEGEKGRRVWRPRQTSHLSKSVSALMPEDWKRFICVESGAMKPEAAYMLKPGERHTIEVSMRLSPRR